MPFSGIRTRTRTRRLGFVADVCSACEQPRVAHLDIDEQRSASVLCWIIAFPVGPWSRLSCHTVCTACGGKRRASLNEFTGVETAHANSFEALANLTNPSLSHFGEIETKVRRNEEVTRGERLEFLMHHLRTLSHQMPRARALKKSDGAMIGIWLAIAVASFVALDIIVGPAGPEHFAGALLATKVFSACVFAAIPLAAIRHAMRIHEIRPLVLRFGHVATTINADRTELDDVLEMARYEDLKIVKYI